tara:strand:+ start:200 stop:499 length:300 start_codon:yes stop_codon:yes gene_type:complete
MKSNMEKMKQRRVRNSLHTINRVNFFNPETGVYTKISSTAWYLKIRNQQPCFYLDLNTKFQQMPKACFEATLQRSDVNPIAVQTEINKFMEDNNVIQKN